MTKTVRPSSEGEYQNKWELFIKFLKSKGITPKDLNQSHVLDFFMYLFHDLQRKPSTIRHYKSALTEPLAALGINIKTVEFSKLMKAMDIKRPRRPCARPQWSLNSVLKFIDQMQEPLSEVQLLRKSAFLLLLATGFRISELHACVRQGEYCRFLENGSLSLRPRTSFLAKNESSQKPWKAIIIKPLKTPEGEDSNLCPVATLRKYLDISQSEGSKDLFLPLDKSAKPLQICQLKTAVCQLIVDADPNTKANVKDIRAYAASFALEDTMLLGELVRAIGWSSAVMFYKHYLVEVERLERDVVLPVRISKSQQ